MDAKIVTLKGIVGGGYKDFWEFEGRYRVVKGSRSSKKSKTTALWYITKMMQHPDANLLVIRKVYRTLKDSCFTDLKWAVKRLEVGSWWSFKENPLEIVYKPTGQKIYFRGLDDSQKISSISTEIGVLCWIWIEEAYEISNESDFDMVNEAIRGGAIFGNIFKQVTLTFNPWNNQHWLKARFFDAEDADVLAKTVNYRCNEWLDPSDRVVFENMRIKNPRRYRVAGLGDWGYVDGQVYENWREEAFDATELERCGATSAAYGIDFGYTNDPTAVFCSHIDLNKKIIYVYDEVYKKGMSNELIFTELNKLGIINEPIVADSAEPKSIARLRSLGCLRIRGARKGKDSVKNGIDFLQGFDIIIHPKCVNFITEISNYGWKEDRFGNKMNKPMDDYDHLMDAMRYATESFSRGKLYSFK